MQLGYRNAWLWVEAMNRLAPAPLVEKATGGIGGGYTRLTEEGQRVIADIDTETDYRYQQKKPPPRGH